MRAPRGAALLSTFNGLESAVIGGQVLHVLFVTMRRLDWLIGLPVLPSAVTIG
jgi:hypothetical protein